MKVSTFHYSEPNNGSSTGKPENCVEMYVQPGGPSGAEYNAIDFKRWNDVVCFREFPSICEMGHEVIW